MKPTCLINNPGRTLLLAGILSSVQMAARADYATEILSENPLAYYRFDDGVAVDDLDVAPNLGSLGAAAKGLYSSTVTHAMTGALTGSSNTAISGTVNTMTVPYVAGLNNQGSFTVEVWLNPTVASTPSLTCAISSVNVASPRKGWLIYQDSDLRGFNFRTYNKNGTATAVNIISNDGVVGSNPVTVAGNWYHVAVVWDDVAKVGKIYVNGVLENTSPVVGIVSPAIQEYEANTDSNFTLGSRSDNAFAWSGGIDEPAYYTTALTDAQIQAHYNNGISPSPAPSYDAAVLADSPAGYWRLSEPVFVPRTSPAAANSGSLGAPANGAYFAGSKNVSTGPSASNGFLGMGASNSALGVLTANGHVGTTMPLLNNRTAFTVTGWVKRGALKSTRGGYFGQNDLLEFGDAGSGASIEAWINATGGNIVQPYTFADDAWGFIVLTGDGNNNRLFLDGVEVGSRAATVANYGTSGFNFNIGGGGIFGTSGDYFRGEIDEVAVFDKALTAARVRSLYHAALGNVAPTEATVLASASTVAEGQTYTLTADHDGSPAFTYQWFVDGNPVPASNTKTLSVMAVPHSPAGTPFSYTVTVTNGFGNFTSLTPALVTVVPGLVWEGADATNPTYWDIATTANWRPVSGGAATTFADGVAAVFNDSAVGTTVDVRTTVTPQSVVFSNATKTINVGGAGGIAGATGITKSGGGTTVLSNSNSFTGPVVVNGGTLTLGTGGGNAVPDANTISVNSGTLRFNGPVTGNFANPTNIAAGASLVIEGSGAISVDGGNSITGAGSETFSRDGTVYVNRVNQVGTINITTGDVSFDGSQNANRAAIQAAVTVSTGATMTIRGVNALPTGVNSVNVTLNGGSLSAISGESIAIPGGQSHAHIGNLTLNGGTVLLGYAGAGSAYNGENFQLNGDITVTGTSPSLINADGADNALTGISMFDVRTINVANVTGDAAADLIIVGELQNRDVGPGSSGFNKTGAGTMLLDGTIAHPISGAMTVSQGTLAANGSVAGPLTVAAGATLAPGNGIGTFSSGALTLAGSVVIEINGASADQMNINGGIALSPGSAIALNAVAPTAPSYVLATYTGAVTGGIPNVTGVPAGYTVDLFSTPGQVRLVSTYYTWATGKGLTGANNAPAHDADGDGSSNLLEFITGTNPLTFDVGIASAKVQDVAGSPALTLTVPVRTGATFAAGAGNAMVASVDGVTCRVEASGDLVNWTHVVNEVTPAITAGLPAAPSGYVYHTFRAAGPYSSTSRDLIRMTVAQP